MDRRTFVKTLSVGAVTATSSLSGVKTANAAPFNVVVVGGGFGGASIAKYLRLWGQGNVNVTLIDAKPAHVSCILSNLVLNGQKNLNTLTFDLARAAQKNQFTFRQGLVTKIDKINKKVMVTAPDNSQFELAYDRLVLSPGISFNYPKGINPAWSDATTPVPHAWIAGPQTTNLRLQLSRLPSDGSARVILTIPKAPYRCPPGPYERACVLADYLKTKKNGGKIIIFDANPNIIAEPVNFNKAFTQLYGNIIEYVPNHSVVEVFATTQFAEKSITVTDGTFSRTESCEVLNVIPNHKAPSLLFEAGLIDVGKGKLWAGVHMDTYQSLFDEAIYVIGDSHDSNQPKAGHIANSEAKVCTDAILRDLKLLPPRVMPDQVPVTNSACYSPITSNTASFLNAGFRFNPATRTMVRIEESFGEAETITSDHYKTMLGWANNLFADVY
jgi:NADH dehydrogenase FAD-containing subunit